MKKNILITWTSKWIWNYIAWNLKNDFNIFGISRTKSELDLYREINIDLTKFELFDNLVKNFEQTEIKFDAIILNAWIWYFGKFSSWTDEQYLNIINLNLTSNILLLKKLEKFLIPKAKIIFIWSVIGKKFMKYGAVYQASKFGLRWFAWALKNELKWIWVHIINPKIVDTTFHDEAKIELNFWENKYTSKDEILACINEILNWNDKRFEIDL